MLYISFYNQVMLLVKCLQLHGYELEAADVSGFSVFLFCSFSRFPAICVVKHRFG